MLRARVAVLCARLAPLAFAISLLRDLRGT